MEFLLYGFHQVIWMFKVSFELIISMGLGIRWMFMTIRCFSFAMLDILYFLPHVVWYIFSPRVIRRVSYRCSPTTKRQNLAKFVSMMRMAEAGSSAPTSPSLSASTYPVRSGSIISNRTGCITSAIPVSRENTREFKEDSRSVTPAGDGESTVSTGIRIGVPVTPLVGLDGITTPAWQQHGLGNSLPTYEGMDDEAELERTVKAMTSSHLNCSFDETLLMLQRSYHGLKTRTPAKHADGDEPEPIPPPSHDPDFATALAHSIARVEESDDDDDAQDEEDKQNLHNRATLDIYLPVPVDSLFHAMDEKNKRQLAGDLNFQLKKFPVVISVNGGAWIVGCYFWNFLVARVLAARGYVVFCPDYRNFPQTNMEGMTLDVSDAIGWVLRNADRYNGDLDDVTLVGQSAGAHLTMMSLLSQAHLAGYEAKGGKLSGLPSPSGVAYNVPRYNPRQSIRRYIGLSGIYNVRHLVKHLHKRGLYRHVLHKMAGSKENLPRYSINSYFDARRLGETGEVLPDNFFDFLPQQMFFLHGDADCSAPLTESANLAYMMRTAQKDLLVQKLLTRGVGKPNQEGGQDLLASEMSAPVEIKYILLPGANHTDSIIEEPLAVGNSHLAEFLDMERGGVEVREKKMRRQAKLRKKQEEQMKQAKGGKANTNTPVPPAAVSHEVACLGTLYHTSSPLHQERVYPDAGRLGNPHCVVGAQAADANNNNNSNNSSRHSTSTEGLSASATTASTTVSSLLVTSMAAVGGAAANAGSVMCSTVDPSLFPCVPVENPDDVFICPAPHSERPLLLRAASYVCPF